MRILGGFKLIGVAVVKEAQGLGTTRLDGQL